MRQTENGRLKSNHIITLNVETKLKRLIIISLK